MCLVNNAGIFESQMRVDSMEAARLQRVFGTNVIGAFLCARGAVRRTSTKTGGAGGAIVSVSAGAARLGSPGEYVDDAASKVHSIPLASA
jgi:NAD(P)-dependent dehydrogenase (short-subunit alcohol dehydrogenase family)